MTNYREAEIEVSFRPPMSTAWHRWRIPISEYGATDLAPLPRGRELSWEVEAQEVARKMIHNRTRFASDLTPKILEALETLIAASDPIHGYDPKQWAEMKANK